MSRRRTSSAAGRGRIRAGGGLAAVEAWFAARGWEPWPFQREAWAAYAAGESGLVQVATGAGKTYAAFGGPLAELLEEGSPVGLRVLYVTPLRAVSRDVEHALRAPLAALGAVARVESRTGDTPAALRRRQAARLPEVLVTTPESLTLLLTREDSREALGGLRGVIVDEWHELLATKRGSQVELALARLRGIAPGLRVWGLSATLPNAEGAARLLTGVGVAPARIVRGEMPRPIEIDTLLPSEESRLPWAGHLGLSMLPEVSASLDATKSTIVFTNTRSQAERWYHALLALRPEWEGLAALHHGSIDRAERERVEAGVKSGAIRLVVATSSLDLGVDFAPVERVYQVGSPKGVARLVQRAGRGAHRPMAPARITCVPAHALELLEIAAARDALARGEIEPREAPRRPLDVLVQHLVTAAMGGGFEADALYAEVRTASSFEDLPREEFDWALALVARGGAALGAYADLCRVREEGGRWRVASARHATLHRLNVGTITAEATLEMRLVRGRRLGSIEESFVAGLREGQRFIFAGRTLEFVGVRELEALARPARGKASHTPIWSGTRLPISESLGQAVRRVLGEAGAGRRDSPELAAAAGLIDAQRRVSMVPGEGEVLAEVVRSREGTHLFLFPFEGRLVHSGLGAVLALRLSRLRPATFSIAASDYGLEVLSEEDFPFERLLGREVFSGEGLLDDALASVDASLLMKLQFREIARVSGLVIQSFPGAPKAGRQVQASASLLFDVLREFDPGNLLLEQARREVFERHYEHQRLARAMRRLASATLRIVPASRPSPLSFPLLLERQSGRLSSESLAARIARVREAWSHEWTAPSSSGAAWDEGLGPPREPARAAPRRGRARARSTRRR